MLGRARVREGEKRRGKTRWSPRGPGALADPLVEVVQRTHDEERQNWSMTEQQLGSNFFQHIIIPRRESRKAILGFD
jgi:hypothetical protein